MVMTLSSILEEVSVTTNRQQTTSIYGNEQECTTLALKVCVGNTLFYFRIVLKARPLRAAILSSKLAFYSIFSVSPTFTRKKSDFGAELSARQAPRA